MAIPVSVSVNVESGIAKHIFELISVTLDDLRRCLINDLLVDIVKDANLAVDRTNKGRIWIGINTVDVNLKLRAALRAKGFKLDGDHFGHAGTPAGCVAAPADGDGGDSVNVSLPERQP